MESLSSLSSPESLKSLDSAEFLRFQRPLFPSVWIYLIPVLSSLWIRCSILSNDYLYP